MSHRILIKVCVLLRNRFQEIRDVARGTLVKIIEALGYRYLQYLLKEMQGILVKGYQVGTHTYIRNSLQIIQWSYCLKNLSALPHPGPCVNLYCVPAAGSS